MRAIFAVVCLVVMTSCSMIPKMKWPDWAKSNPPTQTGASAAANAVDRMAEIQTREAKLRSELEDKRKKSLESINAATQAREKIDDDNFNQISEINFGIFAATENIIDIDPRILIANLKAQANMARLMPITSDIQARIRAEIELERTMEKIKLEEKYKAEIKKGHEAKMAYEEAVKKLHAAEAAHAKLVKEQERILADVRIEAERQAERMKKEAEDAVKLAKEAQRAEMIGWIVKSLLGVGIILLIVGFLMKSPVFIVSGIGMTALAYVAATIPFWVVSTLMGIFILAMIVINPKNGKIDWTPWSKEKTPEEESPEVVKPE